MFQDMSPYLSKNYRYPRKSRFQSLQEAGKFFGLSMLAIILVLFILGWVAYAFNASAATGINQQLNYQGKLNDSNGVAVADATYYAKFVIYDGSGASANCLWTAVGACDTSDYGTTTVTTINGVFSATLGGTGHNLLATSSIDWNDDSLYLGVAIRGTAASPVYDDEMTPRKRITSAAYAFNADTIDGIQATSTAAVASYLLSLDSYGNLNLFGQGVSSTYATTTWLYVRGDAQIDGNATTTGYLSVGNYDSSFNFGDGDLNVGDGLVVIDDVLFTRGNLTMASGTVDITGSVYGSTGLPSILNINSVTIETSGTAGYAGLAINIVESTVGSGGRHIINTSVNGQDKFTVRSDGDIILGDNSTIGTWSSLNLLGLGNTGLTISGNATTTGWVNIGSTDVVNTLGSLIGDGDLYVGRNATITDDFTVSSTLYVDDGIVGVATSSPWAGYEFAVTGDSVFAGDFHIEGNATTSGSFSAAEYKISSSTVLTLGDITNISLGVGAGSGISGSATENSTMVGFQAGYGATAGSLTAFGVNAGVGNSDSGVTAIGNSAANNNTGANIVALGGQAASNNTGGYITVLGFNAGVGNTYDAVINLGAYATSTASNQLVVGGDDDGAYITDGYFGRGVKSKTPNSFTLHATGGRDGNINGADLRVVGGYKTGTGIDGDVILAHDGTNVVGSVGIATSTPGSWYGEKLAVAGGAHIYGSVTTTGDLYVGDGLRAIGTTTLATTTIGSVDQYFQFDTFGIAGVGNFPIIRPQGGASGIGLWANDLAITDIADDDSVYLRFGKNDLSVAIDFTADLSTSKLTLDGNFDITPTDTVNPITFDGGTYTGSAQSTLFNTSLIVTNEISDDATFGNMHNSLIFNTDFTGSPGNKTLVSKVFGNLLGRQGTIDGYGSICKEDNYAQRNWVDNDAIYSGSNDYTVNNYVYSSLYRGDEQFDSVGNTLTLHNSNIHISSIARQVETAGTINVSNKGLYIENVSSYQAEGDISALITNGSVTNYGIYIGEILPAENSTTTNYGIYDASGAKAYFAGNVGIGTSTPNVPLDVYSASPSASDTMFRIATSSAAGQVGTAFRVTAEGNVYADGEFTATGADYAEYFRTKDADLTGGEVVCVDITKNNAVARCSRESDPNVMGIVSAKPAILGNAKEGYEDNPNYVIVAMLGQIPAKASAENGEIRPGDSLTSASIPGYIMRANPGDSTVGVALEGLKSGTGTIQVMISRRNKSLTVEQVEQKITQHIAEMEIEDEVNLLVASAIENLNFDQEISNIVGPELALLDTKIDLSTAMLSGLINKNNLDISDLQNTAEELDLRTTEIESVIVVFAEFASSTQAALLGYGVRITDLESNTGLIQENLETASSSIAYLQGEIDNIYEILNNTNTSTEPLVVTEPDLEIETLVVQQAATFYGAIYVYGEAGFEHKVVFNEDIEVKGKIYASKDQAGTITIAANATSTEVSFETEYEVVPKITATLSSLVDVKYAITEKSTAGFRLAVLEPVDQPVTLDWIALAVKTDNKPPIIDNFITSLDSVGFDIPVELWVQVTDPDTEERDLIYTWNFSPNIGQLSGNTGLVTWKVVGGITADTNVKITVTVSDGTSSDSIARIVRVIMPDEPEGGDIVYGPPGDEPGEAGCTDETALNYNPKADEDDGTCEYEEEPMIILGCTDPSADNHDVQATQDDGTCTYTIVGCTDQTALNYNSEANEDDGTCEYPPGGETDEDLVQGDDDGVGGGGI